jgi:hypothetical protein
VDVNIVIKACYSSAFAKAFNVSNQRSVSVHTSAKDNERSYSTGRSISGRLRNSLFGAAFVRTFRLVRDPDEIWTLEKQTSIVKGKLSASTIPPNRRSTAQVVSDSPKTRLMKDIMHRDYVDVTFCEAPVRARRVLTPLNEALGLLHRPVTGLNNHTSADFEAASEMLSHEMGLIIETDYPEDGDEAITGRWFTRDRVSPQHRARTIVQLFQALAYRFKIQEQFLVIAENLTRLELLSINALYTSMNLSKDTKS